MDCSMPGFPVLHYLLKFAQLMFTELVMPYNHPILCYPLLLPSIFPSIRVFSNELALRISWPKYESFSFSLSNEHSSGLISFRTAWFDLADQKTLKSLLQHHSLKPSILWHSAFFTVQLSHPYMTTGKTIALTALTFVGKVTSLIFNTLKFVIAFLPRSNHLLISWQKSPSTVILEPKKMKSFIVSIFSSSICHEVMGPDAMMLVFWMLSLKPAFSQPPFTFIKRLFSSSWLYVIRLVLPAYLRLLGKWFTSLQRTTEKFKCTKVRKTTAAYVLSHWKAGNQAKLEF